MLRRRAASKQRPFTLERPFNTSSSRSLRQLQSTQFVLWAAHYRMTNPRSKVIILILNTIQKTFYMIPIQVGLSAGSLNRFSNYNLRSDLRTTPLVQMITVTITRYLFFAILSTQRIFISYILDHKIYRLAYTICFPGVRTYVPYFLLLFSNQYGRYSGIIKQLSYS
jgi:hypothetical protein